MAKKVEIENEVLEENIEASDSKQEETGDDLLKLKESFRNKSEEAASYLDHLQRLKAEFENYKKRSFEEKAKLKESGKEDILKQLLPVIDNMEKAINHYNKSHDIKPVIKGIELVYKQIQDLLKKEGVSKIDSVGKEFNPLLHEAIITESSGIHNPGVVLEELESGYSFNGRLLRPTRAKVSISEEN